MNTLTPARKGRQLRRAAAFIALSCLALLAASGPVIADDYPSRPIRLVVPFPPGGSVDIMARIMAPGMAKELGQNVLVDNRGGASGAIGTEFVVKSAPDGYTLCFCTTGSTILLPLIDPQLSYNPKRDLAPVTHVINQPFVIVVRTDLNINSLQELIGYAKANPGKYAYGTAGVGVPQHLTGELLAHAAGVKFTHVPYRGDQPALIDLLGGQVQGMFMVALMVNQAVATGKVKAIAVSSSNRLKIFPNLPTIAESGYTDFSSNNYFQGIFAPAGTPAPVIEKIHAATVKALQTPAAVDRMNSDGTISVLEGPQAFAATMERETLRWGSAVKLVNLTSRSQ